METENTQLPIPEELQGRIKLGRLASGEDVYDRTDSHVQLHPQITPEILADALSKVSWPQETKPGTPRGLKVDMKDNPLGKSEVAPVPDREGVYVVWAPRVDTTGKPTHFRDLPDGSKEVMLSPWVVGLAAEEIPVADVMTVALKELPERQTKERWLELRSAYPGNAPREVGTNFELSPFGKEAAWEYWCGKKPDGTIVSKGHAFVFDSGNPPFDLEKALANGTAVRECPYTE